MFILIVALLVTFFLVFCSLHQRKHSVFAGPYSIPLIGNINLLIGDFPTNLANTQAKYGSNFELYFGTKRIVCYGELETLTKLLEHPEINLIGLVNESGLEELRLNQNGIAFNNNLPLWKRNRGLFLRAVNENRFFNGITVAMKQNFLRDLDRKINVPPFGQSKDLSVGEFGEELVADVLEFALFSETLSSKELREKKSMMIEMIHSFSDSVGYFMMVPKFISDLLDFISNKHRSRIVMFYNLFEGIVQSAIERAEQSKEIPSDLNVSTDLLLNLIKVDKEESKVGELISQTEMTNVVRDVMLAGNSMLSLVKAGIYYLSRFPEVQQRLHAELSECAAKEFSITRNNITNLEYLDCFISECLRMVPPAPFVSRQSSQDIWIETKRDRFQVKEGEVLVINIYGLHMDPRIWKDPHNFRPERFLHSQQEDEFKHIAQENMPPNVTSTKDFLIPFVTGLRKCPARAMALLVAKLLVSHLVLNYQMEAPTNSLDVGMKTSFEGLYKVENSSTNVNLRRRNENFVSI